MPEPKDLAPPLPEAAPDEILDSRKLHQLLIQSSLEDAARVTERQEAIARNRARALQLLAVLEKSQNQAG